MRAGEGVPSAVDIEEQKRKRAGDEELTSRDDWRRFCRPWIEGSKADRVSWKFTGHAQWMMWVSSERSVLYVESSRPSLGRLRSLINTESFAWLLMMR